jgi:hypothetical protein
MAQTGFTPIVTYNTATATTIPSAANLAQGELAVNVTDKKLYTKDSGGNVVLLASNGGDVTGPASSTNLAIPTFSGTGGKTLLNNSGVTISAGVITGTGFTGALNGTLGATTPSTVAATDLTTTGNTILGNASTDTLNVGNGGLVKDANGNVGINTASPVNIAGYTIQTINNATTGGGVYLQSNGTSIGRILNTTTDMYVGGVSAASNLVLQSGGAVRATLFAAGGLSLGNIIDPGATNLSVTGTGTFGGIIKPQQATTAGAPAYVKGAIYFDTTLNKLRVGGATAWETITSV